MAGRGPAPKKNRSRARDTHEKQKLVATGELAGFALPKNMLPIDPKTGEREQWHPATRRWWNHWRKSPQANLMLTEPDWDFLLDTALIHHRFWSNGRWEFANELRMRAAKFGATPEDRLRLRVDVTVGEQDAGAKRGTKPGEPASITRLDDRRQQILKGAQ